MLLDEKYIKILDHNGKIVNIDYISMHRSDEYFVMTKGETSGRWVLGSELIG